MKHGTVFSFGIGLATLALMITSTPASAAVTKLVGVAALAAPQAVTGPLGSVELVYTANVSDQDNCSFSTGENPEMCSTLQMGQEGGIEQFTGTYSGTVTAHVPITTNDDLQTPGKGVGVWTESVTSLTGSATYTGQAYDLDCANMTGTSSEIYAGTSMPGSMTVDGLQAMRDSNGSITGFKLSFDPFDGPPTENVTATVNTTDALSTDCIGSATYQGVEQYASDDILAADRPLAGSDSNDIVLTNWTINQNWRSDTGGVLASISLNQTAQFSSPDSGPITANQTLQIVTTPCPPATSGSPSRSAQAAETCPVTYTVTVEQWIPQDEVVDPVMPVPTPYVDTVPPKILSGLDENCHFTPPAAEQRTTEVHSSFHGDGHADFGGSYRIGLKISFDFNGDSISNFKVISAGPMPTIRNKTYISKGKVLGKCSTTALAKFRGGASKTSDTTFTMNAGGANPLVKLAPPTSTTVSGTVLKNGAVNLSVKLADFPSQGIEVTRNGQTILTAIGNDVSCLPSSAVTGLKGALTLGLGLLLRHSQKFTASPDSPSSQDIRSPLCA